MALTRHGGEVGAGQVAIQTGGDPVVQFRQPLPRRRADGQSFEVGCGLDGAQISLVQHLKIGRPHEGGGRIFGALGRGGPHPKTQVGALSSQTGTANALGLDHVIAVAQTRRVRQRDGVAADHYIGVQHVACGPGDGGDDGRLARRQGVEQ
ncbi:hypothetical protein D3C87_714710 [compost metagenome]